MQVSKYRLFAAGFLITVILIGMLCGFMAVDLSTDRYMPGHFQQMFLISAVDENGIAFTFMGEDYLISSQPVAQAKDATKSLRTLRPVQIQLAELLAGHAYAALSS